MAGPCKYKDGAKRCIFLKLSLSFVVYDKCIDGKCYPSFLFQCSFILLQLAGQALQCFRSQYFFTKKRHALRICECSVMKKMDPREPGISSNPSLTPRFDSTRRLVRFLHHRLNISEITWPCVTQTAFIKTSVIHIFIMTSLINPFHCTICPDMW